MAKVRSKNSAPELQVSRTISALGYRYELHAKDLPGCPDVVLRRRHKAIFVHGCFWHLHGNCPRATLPKSRRGFWRLKLRENRKRDKRSNLALRKLGWDVLCIWQCELKDKHRLRDSLQEFLRS